MLCSANGEDVLKRNAGDGGWRRHEPHSLDSHVTCRLLTRGVLLHQHSRSLRTTSSWIVDVQESDQTSAFCAQLRHEADMFGVQDGVVCLRVNAQHRADRLRRKRVVEKRD